MTPNERLAFLADFLDTQCPPEHFDLQCWIDSSSPVTSQEDLHTCGTTACAVGWACCLPEFQREGLHLSTYAPAYKPREGGDVHHHWEAVTAFFDLAEDEAEHLFSYEKYDFMVFPWNVAARIRELLRGRA